VVGGRWMPAIRALSTAGDSVVMNFASYFFSDKLALAMSGAQPLTPESAPDVYPRIAPMVENIARG